MQETRPTKDQVLSRLGNMLDQATPEEQEAISTFLTGYLAGLEYLMNKKQPVMQG